MIFQSIWKNWLIAKKSSPPIGIQMPSFPLRKEIIHSTISKSMQVNHFQSGRRRAGYIRRIHEDGFNGIADITWVEERQMMFDK